MEQNLKELIEHGLCRTFLIYVNLTHLLNRCKIVNLSQCGIYCNVVAVISFHQLIIVVIVWCCSDVICIYSSNSLNNISNSFSTKRRHGRPSRKPHLRFFSIFRYSCCSNCCTRFLCIPWLSTVKAILLIGLVFQKASSLLKTFLL